MSKEAIGPETKVTLWLVITLVGGIAWLFNIHSDVAAQSVDISNVKSQQQVWSTYVIEELRNIRKRLDEINDKLDKH